MKSIVWKEFRENLRWSLLAFLGMGVCMGAALDLDFRGLTVVSRNLHSVLSPQFQTVTAVGSAVVGLALGLLQVAFEGRGDRFSLLVHRPATRSAIFAAKVIAGGALYLFPTAVPFLLASWWAATPGHVPAPFAGSMMLPGVVDILLGFTYYLAGLLTGMRAARWYGSRGLGITGTVVLSCLTIGGIAAAMFFSCLTIVVHSFAVAVLLALVGIVVLSLAAWGSFVSGGPSGSEPLAARAALTACLVVGLGLIAFLVCHGVHRVAREIGISTESRLEEVAVSGGHTILRDGRVIRNGGDLDVDAALRDRKVIRNGRTLDGEVVEFSPEEQVHPDSVGLALFPGLPYGPFLTSGYRWRPRFPLLTRLSNSVWYFDPEEGLLEQFLDDYNREVDFVGYFNPVTLAVQPEKPAKRLEYRGESTPQWRFTPETGFWFGGGGVYVFSDVVYHWHAKALRTLYTVSEGEDPMIAGGRLQGRFERRPGGRERIPPFAYAAFVSESELLVLGESGDEVLRTPMISEWSRFQSVGVAPLDGDRYAVYFTARLNMDLGSGETPQEEVIRIVSASGDVLEERRVAPSLGSVPASLLLSDFAGPGTPFPALLLAWLEDGIRTDVRYSIVLERWYVFATLSLACAVAAFVIARRYAFSTYRLWLWTGINLLLGPVGLATFLSLEDWPPRDHCHSCGHRRIVTRARCERCGAEWPAPLPDGTEIFC